MYGRSSEPASEAPSWFGRGLVGVWLKLTQISNIVIKIVTH